MSLEDDIRNLLDNAATPDPLTAVGDHRESVADNQLAAFDDALERVLNERRNGPAQPPAAPLVDGAALQAAIDAAQKRAEAAETKADEALRRLHDLLPQRAGHKP